MLATSTQKSRLSCMKSSAYWTKTPMNKLSADFQNEIPEIDLSRHRSQVTRLDTVRGNGLVTQVIGLVVESIGPAAQVGEICEIRHARRSIPTIKAEVVGFKA